MRKGTGEEPKVMKSFGEADIDGCSAWTHHWVTILVVHALSSTALGRIGDVES